jgi:hypothetical protein
MATMIAARLHAYDHAMRLDRILILEPRPTEVLVEIRACGIVLTCRRSRRSSGLIRLAAGTSGVDISLYYHRLHL